jgi:hypothetical protein
MMIGKKEGQILKDFLLKSSPEVAAQASLQAEFIIHNHDNTVKWQLWYTSANDKALDFIKNFKEDMTALDTTVDFTPRIVTWACTGCDADFKRKECVSNGKYCSMNHKSTYIQGKDIITEDLRELCLHKLLSQDKEQSKWWEYMSYVHKMCYEEVNEECSKLGHK